MTLLVAAVIVHDKATNRVVRERQVRRGEPRKHAQVCWVDTDAIPEEFVDTTANALRQYLGDGPQVSLDGWKQS